MCDDNLTIDDFSSDEILDELDRRLKSSGRYNHMMGKDEIIEWIKSNTMLAITLEDIQKNELFEEAREKFTIEQLTKRLDPNTVI